MRTAKENRKKNTGISETIEKNMDTQNINTLEKQDDEVEMEESVTESTDTNDNIDIRVSDKDDDKDDEASVSPPKKVSEKKRRRSEGLPSASIKRIMLIGGNGISLGKKKTKEGKQSKTDSKLRISMSAVQYMKNTAESWIDSLTIQSMLFMKVAKRKVLQTEDLEAAVQTKYPSFDLMKLKSAKSKDNFELYRKKGPKIGGSKPVLYLPTASIRKVIKKKAGDTKVREGFKIGMQYFVEQKILDIAHLATRFTAEKNKKTLELKTLIFIVEEYRRY